MSTKASSSKYLLPNRNLSRFSPVRSTSLLSVRCLHSLRRTGAYTKDALVSHVSVSTKPKFLPTLPATNTPHTPIYTRPSTGAIARPANAEHIMYAICVYHSLRRRTNHRIGQLARSGDRRSTYHCKWPVYLIIISLSPAQQDPANRISLANLAHVADTMGRCIISIRSQAGPSESPRS